MLVPTTESRNAPLWRWVLILALGQIAMAALMGLVLHLLSLKQGSWVSAVATLVVAQVWATSAEQKVPGWVADHRKQLSLGVAVVQLILGVVILFGLDGFELPLTWKLVIVALSLVLGFAATWFGLGQGIKLAHKAAEQQAKKNKPTVSG